MNASSCFQVRAFGCGILLGATVLGSRAQIPCATEPFSRQNKWEVYGLGQYLHSDNTTFPGPYGQGVRLKMDDTGLGGVGLAYHFSDFFSLRGDFMFGPATFHALGAIDTESGSSKSGFLQTGRLNLDYNMINRRLTPVLSAGIGYQYLQVDTQDTYVVGGPFGRYYATLDSSYYETDFTGNVGAGFRWNVTDQLFIKVMGGAQWLKYTGANSITTQLEGFFVVGWMF
jgi:hypothetical protein